MSNIHDQHPVAQQPHDVEVVADKEIAHAQPTFQTLELALAWLLLIVVLVLPLPCFFSMPR